MSKLIDLTGQNFNNWTVIRKSYSKPKNQNRTYWICECKCGKIKSVYANSLKSGKSKSCGCIKGKPEGEAAKKSAYNLYKVGAKQRNLKFDIGLEEFIKLSSKNCYYCNSSPSNLAGSDKNNGKYLYNGLDRVNNTIGYKLDNVVPCCKNCNLAKRELTKKEFLNMIKMIYERHCNE